MGNTPADIIRVGDVAATLGTTLRNSQIGQESDGDRRLCWKDAGGSLHYYDKKENTNDTDILITDNVANAFRVRETTREYINVNTTDASEAMSFGNTTTNPSFTFLGTGGFAIGTASPSSFVEIEKDQNAITKLTLDNNTSDTAAKTGLAIQASNGEVDLIMHSLGYTTSDQYIADACLLEGVGVENVVISNNADKPISFWIDGSKIEEITSAGVAITGTLGAGATTVTSLTDGTATLSSGNLTDMGNITGADVDISAGTGDFLTSGTLGCGAATVTSLTDGTATLNAGALTAMASLTFVDSGIINNNTGELEIQKGGTKKLGIEATVVKTYDNFNIGNELTITNQVDLSTGASSFGAAESAVDAIAGYGTVLTAPASTENFYAFTATNSQFFVLINNGSVTGYYGLNGTTANILVGAGTKTTVYYDAGVGKLF